MFSNPTTQEIADDVHAKMVDLRRELATRHVALHWFVGEDEMVHLLLSPDYQGDSLPINPDGWPTYGDAELSPGTIKLLAVDALIDLVTEQVPEVGW